jgi:hypothetical protein
MKVLCCPAAPPRPAKHVPIERSCPIEPRRYAPPKNSRIIIARLKGTYPRYLVPSRRRNHEARACRAQNPQKRNFCFNSWQPRGQPRSTPRDRPYPHPKHIAAPDGISTLVNFDSRPQDDSPVILSLLSPLPPAFFLPIPHCSLVPAPPHRPTAPSRARPLHQSQLPSYPRQFFVSDRPPARASVLAVLVLFNI